jgi:hypothetical protein
MVPRLIHDFTPRLLVDRPRDAKQYKIHWVGKNEAYTGESRLYCLKHLLEWNGKHN